MKRGKFTLTASLILIAALLSITIGSGAALAKPKLVVWGRATFAPAQHYWANDFMYRWAADKGVDIKISWLPVTDMSPKLITAVTAGNPPDIVIGGFPVLKFAEADLLLQLDDVVDKLGRDDFFDIKLKVGNVGGKIYAIPTGFELAWLHVRKDFFEKAGLMNQVPFKNEKELLLAAEKLQGIESGVYGIGLPAGGSGYDTSWIFMSYWYGFGGGLLKDRTVDGVVVGKEPYRSGLKKAFLFYREVMNKKLTPPDAGEWTDFSNNQAFINGTVAMTTNPMSIWYAIMTGKPDFVPKTRVIPDAYPIDLNEESSFIFKKTEHAELAKDLLYSFFADKDAYRKGWCEQSHYYNLPIFKSQMKIISENWKQGKIPVMAIDPYEAAMRTKFHAQPYTVPLGEATSIMDDLANSWVINDWITRAVARGEDLDELIDGIQKQVEDMVREAYEQ
jgi:multiple sugar transport system substrate-binding protein